jgi:microcin C transport system substrate-binding protein
MASFSVQFCPSGHRVNEPRLHLPRSVIPAQAGTYDMVAQGAVVVDTHDRPHHLIKSRTVLPWVPAFAGMTFLVGLAFVVLASAFLTVAPPPASAEPRHGISIFGDLKYPADFKHFEYVNPEAPKGGRLATMGTGALQTFNSFNGYILKGDVAQGLGLTFDSLMVRATDEPDSMYGLVAKSADIAADRLSVTFVLRSEAKFSDGQPLTADDVAFTFDTLKAKGHPQYRLLLRDVVKCEALDPATVRFSFQGDQIRDLPLLVAGLPVLSKTFYATRNFEETTLEPVLGSGPYKIGEFTQGKFVTYQRRTDYWGKDLPVNRGRYNFDEVRLDYYADRTAALEGFKAGIYDVREEFTAKDWISSYDFPAVKEGRVVKVTLPDENPSGTQGFFINQRRAKFADVRVRRALDLAFDFEWTSNNIFSNVYTRTQSYFENSPMKATGKPSPEELALLEPLRTQLPPEVFGEPYLPPVSNASGEDRKLLREADALLNAAGFGVKDGRRVNDKGVVLDIEFLIVDPSSERLLGGYVSNLKRIGIAASLRRIDPAQYERRVKEFDFDIVTTRFVMSLTPGSELRAYFGSETAEMAGSRNLAGIKNPAVDALIVRLGEAKSRAEVHTVAAALDRVLRANNYWVSHYFKASHHVAYWDKFARPATKPKYARGIDDTWWIDAAKAAKLKQTP